MDNFDPYAYEIKIIREILDGVVYFKATITGFDDFSLYESTPNWAWYYTIEAIISLHEMAVEHGHPFPSPQKEESHVVITKNSSGVIVSVTRQDSEGKIIDIISESSVV